MNAPKHPLYGMGVDEGITVELDNERLRFVNDEGETIVGLSPSASAAILRLVPADPTLEQMAPAMAVLGSTWALYEEGQRRGKRWGRKEREQEIYSTVQGLLGLDRIGKVLEGIEGSLDYANNSR
jgi:hypothetical protein